MQYSPRSKHLLIWILPTAGEVIGYITVVLVSIAISNVNVVNSFLNTPSNFHLSSAILDSINSLLQRFVGDHAARAGVVAFFWALVGLLAYLVIWIISNFSNELGNDLAMKSYAHPSGYDTSSPLRMLLSRSLFRLVVFIFLVFYVNALVVVIMPLCGGLFKEAATVWPRARSFELGLIGVITELVTLHIFTVLLRLLLIKKRIFGT